MAFMANANYKPWTMAEIADPLSRFSDYHYEYTAAAEKREWKIKVRPEAGQVFSAAANKTV